MKGVVIKDVAFSDSAITDSDGNFTLKITNPDPRKYSFEANDFIGFELEFTWYDTMEVNTYYLTEEKQELETVVIRKKKERYRNKDNPAVALIRKVTEHKEENRIVSSQYSTYNSYEKVSVSATNIPRWVKRFFLFRPFRYIFDNVDTISYPGFKLMPVFIEESWSRHYERQSPKAQKRVITKNKTVTFDRDYINEEGAVSKLNHLYQDINIYDDNFILVSNSFMSPTNSLSPTFYKFFIMDTVIEDNKRFVLLDFEPRNPVDLLLMGRLKIGIDDNYAVTEVVMSTSRYVNINFIKSMKIEQKFKRNNEGKFYPYYDRNFAQFVLYDGLKQGMIGERVIHRDSMNKAERLNDSLFSEPQKEKVLVDSGYNSLDYEKIRPVSLSPHEYRTYRDIDSMKSSQYFKSLVKFGYIISKGFYPIGDYEIGPLYRTFSMNSVEGFRWRIGGRNNNLKIRNFNINTYLAYGMKDKRFKYLLSGMYSFNGKGLYDYPMRYIKVQIQQENKVPGRLFETSVQDNIFETIQRGRNDKFLMVNDYFVEYMYEFPKNIQVSADARYTKQTPTGALYFIKNNGTNYDTIPNVTSSIIGVRLRWAPGEKYMVNRAQRSGLLHQNPIFTLRAEMAIPGLLGATSEYKKFSMTIDKRTSLGPLGFLDARLSGNIIIGTLPYHLLNIPRANQGYTFSFNSYMLMNNGEFVSDRQVEAVLNYRMMGFILNKIPLINRLKLREVAGFKMVYGSLSANNNPNLNPNQILFPTNEKGQSLVNQFGNVPYMEYSVGIENILKLFRIDYVRRLTYLDNPYVSKQGIRATLIFNF